MRWMRERSVGFLTVASLPFFSSRPPFSARFSNMMTALKGSIYSLETREPSFVGVRSPSGLSTIIPLSERKARTFSKAASRCQGSC